MDRSDSRKRLDRTLLMLGEDAVGKLEKAHVAVFGLGGVGGYVCEALARSGVGELTIVDNDNVDVTNLNRQIIATTDTIGRSKTDVMEERLLSTAPGIKVNKKKLFFLPETSAGFDFSAFDYVVDAIDTVKAKLELIECCGKADTPVISSMGAGNRMDPSMFRVADISKTEMDPLAKVMRRELRSRGIDHVKVVFSKEKPLKTVVIPSKDSDTEEKGAAARHAPGSMAFCPGAAGLLIASEVVKDLIK